MSNKKLNIKSERLSRSLWLSDEFYSETDASSVDKVVGKIYKNAAKFSSPSVNSLIGADTAYPRFHPRDNDYGYGLSITDIGDDPNFLQYGTYPTMPISPATGKLFFCLTPEEGCGYWLASLNNSSENSADHVGESWVISVNEHLSYATYGRPLAAAPFKVVNYQQFKEYLSTPVQNAPAYEEQIPQLLANLSEYESEGATITECTFLILDENYSNLCSSPGMGEDWEALYTLYHAYSSVVRANTSKGSGVMISCFPADTYNGAYAVEEAYESTSTMHNILHSIVEDPTQPEGWYWDGLGWRAWEGEDGLDAEEVKEIVNDMSLTNVTTGAFGLPTIDYGELLAQYDVSSTSNHHTASCSWIRIMKIPNFNAELIYNIIVPSSFEYLTAQTDGNYMGSLYLSWNYRLIPGGGTVSITTESAYKSEEALLKIDDEGYLWLKMTLKLDTDGYENVSYTAAEIVNYTSVPLWLNSLYIVPSIKTDSYECNWNNYMSSTTMSLVDTEAGQSTYADNLDQICLFSTQAFSSSRCGYGDYRYSFSFKFTPKASGTYTVLFAIVPTSNGATTVVKCNAGTESGPTDVAGYNGREVTLTGSSTTQYPFFAGFQITCDADVVQYIHINSTGGYFSLMYFEIYGLPTMQTSDEGAQLPDNGAFISNTYYSLRKYTPEVEIRNTMSTDSLFGWSMTPEIWEVDTTA